MGRQNLTTVKQRTRIEELRQAFTVSSRPSHMSQEPGGAEDESSRVTFFMSDGTTALFRFHPDDLEERWGTGVKKAILADVEP